MRYGGPPPARAFFAGMPFDVTVRVKAPEGVTSKMVEDYVRRACRTYGGSLRATDPAFSLGARCTIVSIRGTPGLRRGEKFHTTSRGDTYAVPRERHERV